MPTLTLVATPDRDHTPAQRDPELIALDQLIPRQRPPATARPYARSTRYGDLTAAPVLPEYV